MAGLAPAARARLAKLCGMLGSAHAGERANAAALADRLVRDEGSTWTELLSGDGGGVDELTAADILERYGDALPERDREFLVGIKDRRRLSERQAKWLDDIRDRCAS